MTKETKKWLLTHDSHTLKTGEVYEGEALPAWLEGKAMPVSELALEATPNADIARLTTELDEATSTIQSLTADKNALTTELDVVKKQLADLQEQAKGKGK